MYSLFIVKKDCFEKHLEKIGVLIHKLTLLTEKLLYQYLQSTDQTDRLRFTFFDDLMTISKIQ
ncbi:hypothetical protein FF38_03152 [Lucilia cuprina]|uniref:Uncharacterized protein n=1 Tax=Lucilia cuprina TaxID=7375 RepID=A0A0L0BWN8_LUCCU|nr:hypothetical protein FF38_03152 [Lucilia cuprina]